MIVKSDRKCNDALILLFICVIAASGLICAASRNVIVTMLVLILAGALCLRQWIAVGKELEICETGVTVSFLWYRKEYSWDALKTKRFVDYKDRYGYKNSCVGGAEFSPVSIRSTLRLKSADYCILVRPVSFFFVCFQPDNISTDAVQYPMFYAVNEADFRNKLDEWGVSLEDTKTD